MKIYVTGMGIVSALGIGVDATLTALRESRSGIGAVKYLDTVHRDLPAGEVPASDAELAAMLRAEAPVSRMRTVMIGAIAAREAMADAGLLPDDLRDDVPTVFALPPVDSKPYLLEDGVRDDWNVLLAVRGAVTRAIEPLRRDSVVGHSLDTSVTLYVADELRERLEGLHTDLRAFFIVSQLHLAPLAEAPADAVQDAEVAGLAVGVAKAAGEKCERCWIYSTELGSDPAHPTLCPRCAKVMAELPEA